jgi:hypothetical protein
MVSGVSSSGNTTPPVRKPADTAKLNAQVNPTNINATLRENYTDPSKDVTNPDNVRPDKIAQQQRDQALTDAQRGGTGGIDFTA